MLLRFAVTNWRSIRDRQELSLVASTLKDEELVKPFEVPGLTERVLPAAAIYGANASGKSNLILALRFFRWFVLNSHSRKPGSRIPIEPFRLSQQAPESTFEIDFIHLNTRYEYHLSLAAEKVTKEHLYAYPSKRRQVWFERSEQQFSFGKSLRGKNATIQELTRPDSVFLSSAASLNHEQLTEVLAYFRDCMLMYEELPPFAFGKYEKYARDSSARQRIVDFLKAADVGIEDVSSSDTERDESIQRMMKDMMAVFKTHMPDVPEEALLPPNAPPRLSFTHRSSQGLIQLSLENESRGTRNFLNMLPPVLEALDSGSTLIVDEIDTSLHPLLAKKLVLLFQQSSSNRGNAQIIFTTHDTNLLARDLLRRDQVWFTEKDRDGSTTLYPLSDIKTRKGDNIEKGYLEGRYGAVPYLGDIDGLFEGEAR